MRELIDANHLDVYPSRGLRSPNRTVGVPLGRDKHPKRSSDVLDHPDERLHVVDVNFRSIPLAVDDHQFVGKARQMNPDEDVDLTFANATTTRQADIALDRGVARELLMPTQEELLGELLETAREQLRWQRAAVLPEVRKTIEKALTTTQLRRVYEMCDGKTTNSDIAAAVGASPASLTNWTRRWRDLGIAYEGDKGNRHLVSLSALGIPIDVVE